MNHKRYELENVCQVCGKSRGNVSHPKCSKILQKQGNGNKPHAAASREKLDKFAKWIFKNER